MTESEYNQRAEEAFRRIEQALDAGDTDIDYENTAGGVLELEFADGGKIVINRQAAAREIWVAAKSGGYHFQWRDGAWHDSRGGGELYAALARLVLAQSGQRLELGGD